VDHQEAVSSRGALLSVLVLALAIGAAGPAAAGLGSAKEAEFASTRILPQGKEEVLELVYQALDEPVGVASMDSETGRVESEYYYHRVGANRFRTKVTVIVTRRSEGTVAGVRAQREILMEALNPGVVHTVEKWQMVGSHDPVRDDIIERIEKAAGVWIDPEEAALREAVKSVAGEGGVVAGVSTGVWEEIAKLKEERRGLLAPIRALDEKALKIVYSGELEPRQDELEAIRSERNRIWEETRPRIIELDRRILELVLSE
jgi:hypothetical protein